MNREEIMQYLYDKKLLLTKAQVIRLSVVIELLILTALTNELKSVMSSGGLSRIIRLNDLTAQLEKLKE